MMVKIKIFRIHVVESNSFDAHHIEATDSFNETLKWGSNRLQIHTSFTENTKFVEPVNWLSVLTVFCHLYEHKMSIK